MNKRFESIDIAKGFAIILVVIGHLSGDFLPRGFEICRDIIYMFHMPLFIFVSGFLYCATRKPQSYLQFENKKFQRLMVPYFTTSIIILLLKLAMQPYLQVDHPVTLLSFLEIFYLPSAGFFLWFIWALWTMMLIIPLFKTTAARKGLLAASVILYFIAPSLPDMFALNKSAQMLIFFVAGTVIADIMSRHNISSFSTLLQSSSIIIFGILATFIVTGGTEGWSPLSVDVITLCVNASGIAMSLSLAFQYRCHASRRLLNWAYSIAAASYLIYLFHTTFQGFTKAILLKLNWFEVSPTSLSAILGIILIIAAGVIVPWWLAKYILPKSRITSLLFGLNSVKKSEN